MTILKQNTVAKLQKQSGNAMHMFEKTITKLSNINERIAVAKEKRAIKIQKLNAKAYGFQSEIGQLESAEIKNTRLSEKLVKFLED